MVIKNRIASIEQVLENDMIGVVLQAKARRREHLEEVHQFRRCCSLQMLCVRRHILDDIKQRRIHWLESSFRSRDEAVY